MKTIIVKFTLITFTLLGLCAPASNAAEMTFSAEEYSDGAISTTGTLVGALNVGATETVNTVPFTGINTGYANPIAFAGGVTLDAFNGVGAGAAVGAAGALTNAFFYACAAGYLTFSGLTEGQAYELQLVMSDTRALNMDIWGDQTTNTGASDIVVDHGNSASKIVTGTFTADATGTQSLFIQVVPGCPGQFNALQFRAISDVPEPPDPEPDPVITFDVEDYTDGGLSTTGTLVGALNVGTSETVNTVAFTGITTGYANPIAFADGVSLDAFGGGGVWYNAGAPGLLTNNFFYACAAGYLTFSGLTEGQAYELQLVMSDNRALNMDIWGSQTTNAGASDIVVDHGNSASKLVTGTFTAGAAGTKSLFIQVVPGCPGHFNALQLRAISDVPEPPDPEPEPVITFDVEDYTDGGLSTAGALVGALNVGATETVNTVPFTGITTGYANPIVFAGDVTLDAFGGGGNSINLGAPGPLTNDFFYACAAGYLTFSGLTEGQAYELQLVMSETRALNMQIWGGQTTNAGASDIVVEHGNSASKLVTVTFTADATGTQSLFIQVIPGCPGHINALQLRAVGSARPLVITSVTKTEAETSIVFDSVPGAYYIVEFSYDLITWLELTDSLLATDETTTFIDDSDIQAVRKVLFRVKRQE